ncbi:class I SAM-dependent methyltransferase [Halomonas sp. HL-93]|uniref:class I SAM-dependent methyltransferase n=1 Tax=Halomonas sp. HL-93 TaxID=1666906 RepID=UPI0006DA653A|nr:class I SAM-dependent methyltransferase [Halomonas sp. HL-93]KPQ24127.1 MAG: Methylase involved in ubiquinone/menaquinone biosynthesis [Halomonas sp. HL-93]SBR49372.1 Ubiquinone/menaquinone biosynthesis C-methylase UbiE [Halomonas sp. HL-93]
MAFHSPLVAHYQQALRDREVLDQIRAHYPDGPTLRQLAPLDQLHIGGMAASAKLLNLIDPSEPTRVLDIGAGLGGLMRQGAALGYHMVGLDLTHRFNVLNQSLSALVENPDTPPLAWITADACALPFTAGCFDAVVFQHSLLNMPDAARVIGECHRVLSSQGQLVMHEVVSGPNVADLIYPVPWATSAAHSHLLTQETLVQLLTSKGFHIQHLDDWSDTALEWRQRQRQKEQTPRQAVLSPQWVFGERFMAMGQHLVENLVSGAIKLVEIKASCYSQ